MESSIKLLRLKYHFTLIRQHNEIIFTFSTKLSAESVLAISLTISFSNRSSILTRSTLSFLIPVILLDSFNSAIKSSF